MASLIQNPRQVVVSGGGTPYAAAKRYIYATGTLTPLTTYADSATTTPHAHPQVADANGVFAPAYVSASVQSYRCIIRTSADVSLSDDDAVPTVQFTQAALGAVLFPRTAAEQSASVTPSNYSYQVGDIRRYGAVSGSGDCTTAFTNALAVTDQVTVPAGDWRLDTMVEIGEDQSIRLDSGAVITRYSAHSAATTPMFWLNYSQAALTGAGIGSVITTQNLAPDGVIRIGASSMTARMGRDILYCRLANLKIKGKTAYGQTTGNPDACVKVINPQLDGKASYFHFLTDLVFNASNYGLWLQGWANGLQMSNLHGYWIGNTTLAAKAMIFSQGALDNACAGVFHHYSPDTPTLRFEDYDNTATTDGSNHVSSYNSYSNIVCEQDGAAAYALVANATCTAFKNYVQIVDNVALGYDISTTFRDQNNLVFTSTGASFEDVQVRDDLSVAGDTTLSGLTTLKQSKDTTTAVTYSATMAIDAALGNLFVITATNNTAFTISNPTNAQAGQRITILIRNASGGALGTLTWGADFRAANTTQPANGYSRARHFVYYTTVWVELAPGVDVLN